MSEHPIEEQAAAWDARLRSPDASDADHSAFSDWLQADAEHAETFGRLQAALASIRDHAGHPQLSALRDQGRAAAQMAMTRRTRRQWAAGLIAAGVCAIAVVAAIQLQPWPASRHGAKATGTTAAVAPADTGIYQTALNERSTFSLQDGSSVTLDSGGKLVARFRPAEREIFLLKGQALFHVAKDPSRPFVVRAGDRTVTALGTIFNVRIDDGQVRVTLLEGRVAVRQATGEGRAQVLAPRQELIAFAGAAPQVRSVDVDRAVSWTDGRIYLEDEPLAQAVEEMNRYARNRIVLTDASLGGLRVNGMFRTDNQTGFVAALQATMPIDARTDDQGRVLLQRRGS